MKSRIIGVINILNGIAVQSVNFKKFLPIGSPKIALEYLYSWGIDEIVLLNITRNSENLKSVPNLLKNCFVPISIGGGINSIKDVDFLIKNGADKVIINTNLINNKKLPIDISKKYGKQSLIISIDVKKLNTDYIVFTNSGRKNTKKKLEEAIRLAENSGAGEILINSIDRDGSKKGFDLRLIQIAKKHTNIPINICGGAGKVSDFKKALKFKPSGICAANFFHFKEQRVRVLKNELIKFNYFKIRKDN